MPESPIKVPEMRKTGQVHLGKQDNLSTFMPFFSSKLIEVLKEEEAYSFMSLVADVGGVLGLFIGFNFLMFWDWIVWGIQRLKTTEFLE